MRYMETNARVREPRDWVRDRTRDWKRDRRRQVRGAAALGILGAGTVLGVGRAGQVAGPAPDGTVPGGAMQAFTGGATASAAGAAWDLPNLDHPRVDHFVEVFTGRARDRFAGYLERMGRYQPMISAKLAERGMPQDLIYLAMIESGFNPNAYSHAHASGLWQFIPGTAAGYGLDINRAVDERRDPEKATDAALDYLQSLHDRFGSWYLAAAAYNSGEGRVSRVMKAATGRVRGNEQSYYAISNRLPSETRDYVPLMIAAARIAKEPHRYGFEHVKPDAPEPVKTVTAAPATPLSRIARDVGTTVSEIRRLNPELKLARTRNDGPSTIRVPA